MAEVPTFSMTMLEGTEETEDTDAIILEPTEALDRRLSIIPIGKVTVESTTTSEEAEEHLD